jgi:hypothetical protein
MLSRITMNTKKEIGDFGADGTKVAENRRAGDRAAADYGPACWSLDFNW